MKKVVDYVLICREGVFELEEACREQLSKGYELWGTPMFQVHDNRALVMQAFVKYEDTSKKGAKKDEA